MHNVHFAGMEYAPLMNFAILALRIAVNAVSAPAGRHNTAQVAATAEL